MAFLVKALFRWNESSKNADISIFKNFQAIFFGFFLHIEKFYQVLSAYQISGQLGHPSRNYRGRGGGRFCPPPAIPVCKKPGLFRVKTRLQEVRFYIATDQQQLCPNLTPIGIKLQATMHQFWLGLLTFIEKLNKVHNTTINSF